MTNRPFDGTIQPGDCIRLTHFSKVMRGTTAMFKAPKGHVFVAVFLGTEPKQGTPPLDIMVTLEALGWRKP